MKKRGSPRFETEWAPPVRMLNKSISSGRETMLSRELCSGVVISALIPCKKGIMLKR